MMLSHMALFISLSLSQEWPAPRLIQQRPIGVTNCLVQIWTRRNRYDDPDETLLIRCGRRTILKDDLLDAYVGNIDVSIGGDTRIGVEWERGTGAYLTVIGMTQTETNPKAAIVFDGTGEMVDDGDAIFEELGRRGLNGNWLPAVTNLYRWEDGKYKFAGGFQWRSDAPWEGRYCVLVKPDACPAVNSTTPLNPPPE